MNAEGAGCNLVEFFFSLSRLCRQRRYNSWWCDLNQIWGSNRKNIKILLCQKLNLLSVQVGRASCWAIPWCHHHHQNHYLHQNYHPHPQQNDEDNYCCWKKEGLAKAPVWNIFVGEIDSSSTACYHRLDVRVQVLTCIRMMMTMMTMKRRWWRRTTRRRSYFNWHLSNTNIFDNIFCRPNK